MRRFFSVIAALLLVMAFSGTTFAAQPGRVPNSHVQLSKVTRWTSGGIQPLAGGSYHAGCQLTYYVGSTSQWVFTVWQDFSTDGLGNIRRPPPYASYSYTTRLGWDWYGTSYNPTQWWVHAYTELGVQKTYLFKQYIGGNLSATATGYVQMNAYGNGTWGCTNT